MYLENTALIACYTCSCAFVY